MAAITAALVSGCSTLLPSSKNVTASPWQSYREAIDDMLYRTNTQYAPWTIVESNCKLYARIKTLKTVVKELEKYLIKH